MLEERSLNLGGRETVTRHIDNVVDTTTNPVIPIVITTSAISGELRKCQSIRCPMMDKAVGFFFGRLT